MQTPTAVDFSSASSIIVDNLNQSPPLHSCIFQLDNTTVATGVIKVEAKVASGAYITIATIRMNDFTVVAAGNISLTDNTSYQFKVPDCTGYTAIKLSKVSGTWTTSTVSAYGIDVTGANTCLQPVVLNTANTAQTISSSSATALAVGPNGITNPAFVVNASTASGATGLKITNAASGSGVAMQVITSGTNEVLTIDAAAAALVKIGTLASTALGLQVGSSTSAAGTQLIVQSTNAAALAVGRLGATTPAFSVDASTATSITGVKISSKGTGNGVTMAAIGEASNGAFSIDAQGSGVLALGDTSTGGVTLNRGSRTALQIGQTLTSIGTAQSSTPTSAQLLGGLITHTTVTGAGAITLPTGTAVSTACPRTPATGDMFQCTYANLGGGQTLTVTGATGTTVSGGATIATAKTAILTFYCTGSNAWNIYTTGG